MKTLQEIKDEVAYELSLVYKRNFNTWDEMESFDFNWGTGISKVYSLVQLMEKVAKRFAIEVAKKSLKNASDKLEYEYSDYEEQVDYSFITDENNIPKL